MVLPGKIIFDLIGFSQPEKCKNDSQREGDGRPFSAEALFDIDPEHDIPVSTDYNSNLDFCKKLKGKNADFLIREFTLADGRRSFLLLVDGMCSKQSAEANSPVSQKALFRL